MNKNQTTKGSEGKIYSTQILKALNAAQERVERGIDQQQKILKQIETLEKEQNKTEQKPKEIKKVQTLGGMMSKQQAEQNNKRLRIMKKEGSSKSFRGL